MRKLVVCGADGNFGAIAADTLLSLVPAERARVTAPTVEGTSRYRDAGVDTAVTNFNDTAGLTAAFEGAEKVLVISMPFVGPKRRDAHRNASRAATKHPPSCSSTSSRSSSPRTATPAISPRRCSRQHAQPASDCGWRLSPWRGSPRTRRSGAAPYPAAPRCCSDAPKTPRTS